MEAKRDIITLVVQGITLVIQGILEDAAGVVVHLEQLEFDENDLCWAHTGVLEIFSRVAAAVDPGLLVGDVQSPAEALVNILVAARADLVQKWLSNCVTVWWTKMDSDKRCQEVESRRRCAMVTLIDLMLKTVANEPVARELSMLPDGMLPEEVRERVEQFDQLVHRLKHAAEDKEVKFHRYHAGLPTKG